MRKRFDDHTLVVTVSLEDETDSQRPKGCGLFGIARTFRFRSEEATRRQLESVASGAMGEFCNHGDNH
ncbi:hypothetical protein [Rhizobium hidalgonense]|uniref:Uncharacterized protein n=1 Tax=Rhizobium hidalgonense TaxID=1538159 RepID=A0AAJ2GWD8_9HYPH|nr:hypothetical protein [Rhizobium hidalgonense]MDR9776181.1 hypothetical protein [Rhizobium hidalgonense]MDR9808080.1 hypothetical protein [Rhizobium hidalgonense]MDR9812434.1 hypothetical protein [Rhizobium hidalgonense]MDR9822628.1 hypothetical protein [Rhizobium hidalgonense]RWX17905.1 hypothetical protein EHI42_09080 [Rhizobium hidalgonense]